MTTKTMSGTLYPGLDLLGRWARLSLNNERLQKYHEDRLSAALYVRTTSSSPDIFSSFCVRPDCSPSVGRVANSSTLARHVLNLVTVSYSKPDFISLIDTVASRNRQVGSRLANNLSMNLSEVLPSVSKCEGAGPR